MSVAVESASSPCRSTGQGSVREAESDTALSSVSRSPSTSTRTGQGVRSAPER